MAFQLGPIIFPFTGSGVGGSHISTFLLAQSLHRDQGVKTVILAVEGSGVASEASSRGLDVRTFPGPPARRRDLLSDLLRVGSRRKLLQSFGGGAVVHVSDLWTAQAWGLPAKSLGLPCVYHHRAFVSGKLRDRALIKCADAVLSISEACSLNLSQVGIPGSTAILNPFEAIPDPEAHRGARAEFQTRWPIDGLRLVGFSANFQSRKRARFFVEVAKEVAERDHRARFIVFGRDRDETAGELSVLAAQLGLEGKMAFPGFRSPPERNIAALDVLAVPALAEPFGRTLVEAILLGVPYVATDDAGHSEIVRRWGGGIAVPTNASAASFGTEILAALDETGLSLTQQDRGRVAEQLRPSTHSDLVLKVYERLASRNSNITASTS